MSSNNHFVAFQDINDEYSWVNYGDFKLIMMKNNGYVNVTKMCEESGKSFFNWKKNSRSKELIKCLIDENSSLLIRRDENYLLTVVSGGNQHETYLRGTYAHPDLVLDIACWLSGEFYIKASKIVREYFNKQERERMEELHKKDIDRLENEKSELQKIREKLEIEFEKADEERKKADIERKKSEEERKKADIRFVELCKKYDIQYDTLLDIKVELVDTKVELKDTKTELKDTKVELKDTKTELVDLNIELKDTKEKVIEMKNEVIIVKDNFTITNERIEEMKTDISILKDNTDMLIEDVRSGNDMLEYMIDENNLLKEEIGDVKENLNKVSEKLGISVEDRVSKPQKSSKLEMFIILQKNDYKNNSKTYEYYAICGQIGYSNHKAKKMIKDEYYSELFKIEYTPNTKNLFHRLKENLKSKIKFSSNKFNVSISKERLIEEVKNIETEKRNVESRSECENNIFERYII